MMPPATELWTDPVVGREWNNKRQQCGAVAPGFSKVSLPHKLTFARRLTIIRYRTRWKIRRGSACRMRTVPYGCRPGSISAEFVIPILMLQNRSELKLIGKGTLLIRSRSSVADKGRLELNMSSIDREWALCYVWAIE